MKRLLLFLVLLLIVLVLVLVLRRPLQDVAPSPEPQPTLPPTISSPPAPPPTRPPAYDPALDQLNQPDRTVQDDLRLLGALFDRYRLIVKDPSGNPGGTHEEIVAALQGRNRTRLAFLPAQHPALNERNELIDRWGTPYFFHALSSTRMEVRSAGPDRRMWTEDDVRHPEPPPRRDTEISTSAK